MTTPRDRPSPQPRALGPDAREVGPPPRALDLADWLARKGVSDGPTRPVVVPRPSGPRPISRPSVSLAERASSYLSTLPPAVSGQGGHGRTFRAACVLVKGFGLGVDEARPILQEWNRGCDPPWSERELDHKLREADKAADDRPRGWLLTDRGSPATGSGAPRPSVPSSQASPAAPSIPQPPGDPPPAAGDGDGEDVELRTNPHRLARLFLGRRFSHAGGLGLRFWSDAFHRWDGSSYRIVPTTELRALLAQDLADEFRRLHRLDRERAEEESRGPGKGRRGSRPLGPAPVTTRLIGDVVQALAGLTLVPGESCPSRPAWLESGVEAAATGPDAASRWWCDLSGWPAAELIATRNALVHPPSFVTGAACMSRPSPRYFNASALDYDFDPEAPPPRAWLAFLRDVWPDDPDSIAALQEWFGYLLTSETRLQKVLMMIGPKRSGRGTIARVLKSLAGPSNVVSPTLSTLARPFGLSVLIDKPVAVFPDARLSSRPDNAAIVEALLSISGEDDQAIDRKHQSAWTGKLPTRFVLISNELPRLRDSSRALSSRLVLLRFTRSFYGNEDLGLSARLHGELPGILIWALEGWRRLQLRGRFIQPASGRPLLESMDELASPVSVFLEDCCVVEPMASIPSTELYDAWRSWCRRHGREAVGDEQALGRDLHAAIPGLGKRRHRIGSTRVVFYSGVRLLAPSGAERALPTLS
ncbi:phage/plasmid primase, P4 family [Paludisphaera soli]|uniref:phage/plasmid primase, P4 family n=1 Tax=Paludisphaera soli TaxID=2712865 RepID=UPI0013EBA33F|nr:phage/plasmid primase, P4 family [Paludisphaera soli]